MLFLDTNKGKNEALNLTRHLRRREHVHIAGAVRERTLGAVVSEELRTLMGITDELFS